MKQLVILGGGFAGLWAAMSAAGERADNKAVKIDITLISKDAHLVIRPRLYEGAGEDKRVLLKSLLDKIGVRFIQATIESIDPQHKQVLLSNHTSAQISYDAVILATGSYLKQLDVTGVKQYGFSADTYEETERLDQQLTRIVAAQEEAAKTLVVIGAGFTGLELATELRSRLKKKSDKTCRIILIDKEEIAGAELGVNPKPYIDEALRLHNIELSLGTSIKELTENRVTLADGEVIEAQTVVFANGMEANKLTNNFGKPDVGAQGRLAVAQDLSIPGYDNAYGAGDVVWAYTEPQASSDDSELMTSSEKSLAYNPDRPRTLFSCQHAIQLGRFAGYNAIKKLRGQPGKDYEQTFYATCLDLGDWGALFTTGWDRVADKTGVEGKEMKKMINTQWIYPPSPELSPEEIHAFVAFDEEESAA
ncbi:FAD-dependent oxidoreductase [uncultured Kiloniella sp.]|uniref:NAD(P)/FAD-dependent oxidoreductase n=1 Tax=uncultured Kiloniella sp. TaxID=1133091 RepID=UPI00260A4742|nr:FAD-dependent oxidoreductase [uncultured Kiloniella sp.]